MGNSIYPLADPGAFHDACGTGFVAETTGRPSRRAVLLSLDALKRLTHRGARSADRKSGDGAGILTDLPPLLQEVARDRFGWSEGEGESLAVAMLFTYPDEREALLRAFRQTAEGQGLRWLGVREVPTRPEALGDAARSSCPEILQPLLGVTGNAQRSAEQQLYLARRVVESHIALQGGRSFVCSFSSKVIVYKGQLTSGQLEHFYPDLQSPEYRSRFAIFHERFSTNTLPSWAMAQPFRMTAHNGEINTVKGNRLWMRSREGEIRSDLWGEHLARLTPVIQPGGSDSLSLDNVLELLCRSGRSIEHGLMMLVPEPYAAAPDMAAELRDFYVYHESRIEPWDGPAALVFTDGDCVGARLDRNGLRPLRYTLTRDGLVVMASEAGVVDVDPDAVVLHHHMTSGEIFAVELDGSGILDDERIKTAVARGAPYGELLARGSEALARGDAVEEFGAFALPEEGFDLRLRVALGWHKEDLTRFVLPMALSGREPIGSMGDDTPLAVLSAGDRRFYDFFKQSFAQVTNPPIDPIREQFVTGLFKYLGSEDNLLATESRFGGAIRIESPVLSPSELHRLTALHDSFPHARLATHLQPDEAFAQCLERIEQEADRQAREGCRLILLTDEGLGPHRLPIPISLVVSTVHHHLIRQRLRSRVSLICLTGDLVEDHHVACLIGLGASAVYPYMAYELIREHFRDDPEWPARMAHYRWALEKGLLKIMAKMGISTVSGYHGSMLFHCVGLSRELLERYIPSIGGAIGGVGLAWIRDRMIERSEQAFAAARPSLPDRGQFRFRKNGELHAFAPRTFRRLRRIAEGEPAGDGDEAPIVHLRDLLELRHGEAVPLDRVEPVAELLRRFGAGAISFGAISDESHRVLARGMNAVGARSSSGEGGEPPDRYAQGSPDRGANCTIKQVASGRFGVTADYLAAASELQIKMAQGAKPGEGGQLPGHKVTFEIAQARSATPGVPLISPPPHHDIYSIEDLAQLIYDLKQVNPRCRVSVKLVAQPGVGMVACGVVKAGADIVLISGGDGGTGATPLGSMKHAGLPWELGLAETHQTLALNELRSRVTLRVDGGLSDGRDVVVAALLGAEEFDFGTAALVALGCVMARQCHLNTCPAGIATQDPALRRRFRGRPEDVARFLTAVAEEVRTLLSAMGRHTLQDVIGRSDLLAEREELAGWIDERGIDLSAILNPTAVRGLPLESGLKYRPTDERERLHLDEEIFAEVRQAIMTQGQAVVHRTIRNTDRSVGARLSGELAFLFGRGAFHGNIQCRLRGVAGQSFGAFLTDGLELRLRGAANDYVCKGMSGGLVTIRLERAIRERGRAQTVIGNVALYGATGGTLLVAGRAGERFAVRNSGAAAVVEGVGNHCCEYMTRGTVVVLGELGRNFGAGMTGGEAYLYQPAERRLEHLNTDFVREVGLGEADESLVLRLLRRHVFHCGSLLAQTLLDDWQVERFRFTKVVPLATEILDFEQIYDQHVAARMGVLLNE